MIFQLARSDLQLGWIGLIVPIAVVAITAIFRAFTAEARIMKDCGDNVSKVREGVLTEYILPTLAELITGVQPFVDFTKKKFLPGEPGDPKFEVARVLGYNPTFTSAYRALEDHYAKIHRANLVHGKRVGHAQRTGIAAATFLICWIYVGCLLCMPTISFPGPLSIAAISAGSVALGWAGAEALGSVRENNTLSELTRESRTAGGSTR